MDHESDIDHRAVGLATSLEMRWFVGAIVFVPMLLAIGVYWLHHVPVGPPQREWMPVVQVELIQRPSPAATVAETALQSNPPSAHDRKEPPVDEPERPVLLDPAARPPPRTASLAPLGPVLETRPPSPAVPAQPASSIASKFQKTLLAHIAHYRRYPSQARRDGLQGVVLVVFAMQRSGNVLDVWIESSSGRTVLDSAAVDTIRRAQPLPAIPPQLPDRLNISVPIAFALP